MNRSSIALYSVMLGVWTAGAAAGDRYQAVPLNPGYEFGTEKALILDTVAGHLWIWTESPATDDRPGGRYVIYQGQLVPGHEMGEVVIKQEWPAQGASKGQK